MVRNYIAKLNDNDCRQVIEYMNLGLNATESFFKLLKKNRHNPFKIQSIENRNDKYYWIFKLLEIEMKELNSEQQYIQTC